MRWLFVLLFVSVLVLPACQEVSATQPSPVLLVAENIALRYEIDALNRAYLAGKLDYPQYIAAATALTTLDAKARANGGAITKKDIEEAVGAGVFKLLEAYLPQPTILPPPAK